MSKGRKLKEAGQSEYPRPASSDRFVMLDTQHEPSGTLNIAEGMEFVKGKEFFSDSPESPCRYVEGVGNITSEGL